MISRKGLGSYNELTVTGPAGDRQRVLIAGDAAADGFVAALIGKSISAKVNWSDEAVEFEAPEAGADLGQSILAAATKRSRLYDIGGVCALVIGVFLGLTGLDLTKRQQPT